MSHPSNSGSDGEIRRRNQPRGGVGKYKWAMQPHHSIQWQKDWLNLATKLFNVDEDDILLNSAEKNEVLSLLANRISDSNISAYSRAVGSCRVVETVRKMMTGKRPLIDVNIYTALLRHSLMPPDAWNETEAILQRLEALRYLERCANGVEKYNPESMSAVMPDKSVVMVIVKPRESIPDAPTERTALTGDSGAATPDKCDNTSGRPWTRSVTTLVSPTSPSKKRKASPEPSLQSKSSPPKRKKATPKRRTTPKKQATPKKTVEQPVIGGSSTKHNGVAQAQDQADSPTSSLRRARRNPVVTSETLAGDNHYILLAKIFKATEVLGQVARYEDKCVRRVALSSFIADLHKAGWTDLEKSAVQLIKDEDCASREFLASMIVNSSYERINEALDKDAAPTKTACDSRPSPWRRVPRILFKSG